jgi:hypothetical protein
MGYYYGIDAIWRTTGVLLGGLSHDIFGFSFTFIVLSILSLIGMPLGMTKDARALALDREGSTCLEKTREATVTHGYGKDKLNEKVVTTLVGVPGLLSCDWFNPEGSETNTTKKDYKPIPLNAVVVKTWDNQTPLVDKQVVFVTNGEVKDPFVAFDRYDDRSLMENNLFRETKQDWHLEDPPKKTRAGVFVQVYMVMAMKALTSAFLMWQEEQTRLLFMR